tara:strand:- start:188 stop:391 length:204 start_codon:yes stop_codon:yes gene_type:complete
MKKYLEFKNSLSNKFWEINFKDKQVVTKFGKIGIQNPASIINNFSSKEEAKKYTDSKIKQKINKGYI